MAPEMHPSNSGCFEWHPSVVTAKRDPELGRGSVVPAAVAAGCLMLFVLTVHAQHIFQPMAPETTGTAIAHAGHGTGDGVSRHVVDAATQVEDCPFPTMLAPEVYHLPDHAGRILLSPVLLLALLFTGCGPRDSCPPPRPSGPARQALLQRFLL